MRTLADRAVSVEIRRVWESNDRLYGTKRVWLTLRQEGFNVARCTVERLMSDMSMAGVQRGRRPRTTIPDRAAVRSPDLVDRRFVAQRPAELWVTDITYVSTWEGWLYVAFVLDAIEMAIWRRDTTNGLTCHSDAGSQFTSYRYAERLANAGIAASIGSVGDSYDNAMAEALNGTYKAELIHRHRPWKTRQQAEFATTEWIDWYNTTRLHGEIDHTPPLEREAEWHQANSSTIMLSTP